MCIGGKGVDEDAAAEGADQIAGHEAGKRDQ
jgi:hypothetical protein